MILNAFILLLTAHILGDIVFNSSRLAALKRTSTLFSQILGIGIHCGIHAFFAGLFLALADGFWLRAIVLVFLFHFFIDTIHCRLDMKFFGADRLYMDRSDFFDWIRGKRGEALKLNIKDLSPWIFINVFDQGSHLVSLYLIARAV